MYIECDFRFEQLRHRAACFGAIGDLFEFCFVHAGNLGVQFQS